MRTLPPRLRKLVLAAHVVASVGWIGALASFLALAVAGLASTDDRIVRGACLAMDLTTRFVIVPLALAALLTGIIQALGTPWGLLRQYWVLFKLAIVAAATIMLLLKTGPIGYVAGAAAETTLAAGDLLGARVSILGHAVVGLMVLLWAAMLGLYKPRGLTPFGRRRRRG